MPTCHCASAAVFWPCLVPKKFYDMRLLLWFKIKSAFTDVLNQTILNFNQIYKKGCLYDTSLVSSLDTYEKQYILILLYTFSYVIDVLLFSIKLINDFRNLLS